MYVPTTLYIILYKAYVYNFIFMDGRREKKKIGGRKGDSEKEWKIFRHGITLIFMSSTNNTEWIYQKGKH